MDSLWHKRSAQEIEKEFTTNVERGISWAEARERIRERGVNELPRGKRNGTLELFIRQFKNPLILLLLGAAVLSALGRKWAEMAVILFAAIINATIGFSQEFRSNKIFRELSRLVRVSAQIKRDGAIVVLDSADLVPGDIVFLQGNMRVPADTRIISADTLYINESALTGESRAVRKTEDIVLGVAGVSDRTNMAYMGTFIERGDGMGIVVATGKDTEIGKIATLTSSLEDERTPLQERLSKLGRVIVICTLVAAGAIAIVGMVEGRGFAEMLTIAVAVAVAAVPEGLPAALSVVLAVSATRILRHKGLVRRLVGAETLGSTSVVVTDKTGTLTEGKMKVEEVFIYQKQATFAEAMACANDVIFTKRENGEEEVVGDETDKAKIEYARGKIKNFKSFLEKRERVALLPFKEDRRIVASFHRLQNNNLYIAVTGAPEAIIEKASLPTQKREELLREAESWARKGFRVIGVGSKEIKKNAIEAKEDVLLRATKVIDFLGFAYIRDPIRKDVLESLASARAAGVRVVMATGDHKYTALAIGKALGFPVNYKSVMEGRDLDGIDDQALDSRIGDLTIFARVSPAHKLRIVESLKRAGEVVAMTGDGVNDAPALKAADIGIAIGSGTEAAKESADIVLLNDGFSVITHAIREGRIAFQNIRKVTVFLFSNAFTETLLIGISLLLRAPFLPVTPVQILWGNLMEDSFPNFALAFEKGEHDIMDQKPMRRGERILDAQGISIAFLIGIISDIALTAFFLHLAFYSNLPADHVQTIIFSLLATNSLIIVFAIKSYRHSIFRTKLFDNTFLLFAVGIGFVSMGFAIYFPPLQKLLGTVPLSFLEILLVIGIGFAQLLLIEVVKWTFRGKKRRPPDRRGEQYDMMIEGVIRESGAA